MESASQASTPLPSMATLPPASMETTTPPLKLDLPTDSMSAVSGSNQQRSSHNPPESFPSSNQNSGVPNCYVFKSRLQEYAQKVGMCTPEYETVKEGPSHEPVFRSTVIVNNVRYDSLPGFFNRKAAEQSAAEVALVEIHKSGHKTECIPTVHETGLCKNMLQEYAQKMNYAIPSYICSKQPSGLSPFFCTVEIGGIQYIGATAKTKKEAEIKAARTALLAIQRSSETSSNGASQYTVVPSKKRAVEAQPEAKKKLKPRKPGFKKWTRKRFLRNKDGHAIQSNKDGLFNGKDGDVSRVPGTNIDAIMGHHQLDCLIWSGSGQGSGQMEGGPGAPPNGFQMLVMETSGYQSPRSAASGAGF